MTATNRSPRKIKLLVISNNPTSHTSFYRSVGPFSYLKQFSGNFAPQSRWFDINVSISDGKIDWTKIIDQDIVFMENPMNVEHKEIFELSKDMDKKVWVDWSLNPLDIQEDSDNPLYAKFSESDTCQTITDLMKNADLLTVPTSKMKEDLSFFNRKIEHLSNALDMDLYTPLKASGEKLALWRSHKYYFNDLNLESILTCSDTYPEWLFIFTTPDTSDLKLLKNIKNIKIVPGTDNVIKYNSWLQKLRPSAIIKDSNDSKYTYIDAGLVSANITTFDNFSTNIDYKIDVLSDVNQKRLQCILRLMEKF